MLREADEEQRLAAHRETKFRIPMSHETFQEEQEEVQQTPKGGEEPRPGGPVMVGGRIWVPPPFFTRNTPARPTPTSTPLMAIDAPAPKSSTDGEATGGAGDSLKEIVSETSKELIRDASSSLIIPSSQPAEVVPKLVEGEDEGYEVIPETQSSVPDISGEVDGSPVILYSGASVQPTREPQILIPGTVSATSQGRQATSEYSQPKSRRSDEDFDGPSADLCMDSIHIPSIAKEPLVLSEHDPRPVTESPEIPSPGPTRPTPSLYMTPEDSLLKGRKRKRTVQEEEMHVEASPPKKVRYGAGNSRLSTAPPTPVSGKSPIDSGDTIGRHVMRSRSRGRKEKTCGKNGNGANKGTPRNLSLSQDPMKALAMALDTNTPRAVLTVAGALTYALFLSIPCYVLIYGISIVIPRADPLSVATPQASMSAEPSYRQKRIHEENKISLEKATTVYETFQSLRSSTPRTPAPIASMSRRMNTRSKGLSVSQSMNAITTSATASRPGFVFAPQKSYYRLARVLEHWEDVPIVETARSAKGKRKGDPITLCRVQFGSGENLDMSMDLLYRSELAEGDVVMIPGSKGGKNRRSARIIKVDSWLEKGNVTVFADGARKKEVVPAEDIAVEIPLGKKEWERRVVRSIADIGREGKATQGSEEIRNTNFHPFEPTHVPSSTDGSHTRTKAPADGLPVPLLTPGGERPHKRIRLIPPSSNSATSSRAKPLQPLRNYAVILALSMSDERGAKIPDSVRKAEKAALQAKIKQLGGRIIEKDFAELVRWDGTFSDDGRRWIWNKGDLQFINGRPFGKKRKVKGKATDDKSGEALIVVADRTNRSVKYMMALATGIPCVDKKWVEDEVDTIIHSLSNILLLSRHSSHGQHTSCQPANASCSALHVLKLYVPIL